MGNALNFSNYEDPPGPGDKVEFFRSLQMKQLKSFFAKLQESRISDFDINNESETVSWRQYFLLFSDINQKLDTDKAEYVRSTWHVATRGFEMQHYEFPEIIEALPPPPVVKARDDLTDDDLSDDEPSPPPSASTSQRESASVDDGESVSSASESVSANSSSLSFSQSSSVQKPSLKPNWDPQITNPIFFGYSGFKTATRLREVEMARERVAIAEERAIQTAQESRVSFIETFDKTTKSQESIRLKKMLDLETKYNEANAKRMEARDANERDLPALGFKIFEVCATCFS